MNADYSYSIHSKELIPNNENRNQKLNIKEINQIYNQELEKIIVQNPEQYFWFHKKWDRKIYK